MSADEQSMRRVTAIRNGTVIDHIPGGMVLQALQIFNVDGRHSNPISLVMNVPSRKLGTKDILKINGTLALEIGNKQFRKVSKILINNNFKIEFRINDYRDNIRCIIAKKLR